MSLSTPYRARIELRSLRNATAVLYDMATAGRQIVAHSLEDEPTSKPLHAALVVCVWSYGKEKGLNILAPRFIFSQMLFLDLPELHMMNPPASLFHQVLTKRGRIAVEGNELKIMELG